MGRREDLEARKKALAESDEAATRELAELAKLAELEADVEAAEQRAAALPCARAWAKACEVLAKRDRYRPARRAFGSGSRYAEVIFRQASKAELLEGEGEAASKALFVACLIWYPGQPDTETIDPKKFEAWLAPYLVTYPMLWAQFCTALAEHTSEVTEVHQGKA